jgi:hypothetical protein
MLQRQLARLENFSHYWSSYSSGSNDLYNNVRQQTTMTLTGTMQSVIQVLQTIQQRQSQELSLEDQRRLSSIIQQSQAISPTSSLNDESAL